MDGKPGATAPVWALIIEYAERHGKYEWEVEDAMTQEWWERWLTYQANVAEKRAEAVRRNSSTTRR